MPIGIPYIIILYSNTKYTRTHLRRKLISRNMHSIIRRCAGWWAVACVAYVPHLHHHDAATRQDGFMRSRLVGVPVARVCPQHLSSVGNSGAAIRQPNPREENRVGV